MALESGTKLGLYEITDQCGMGEMYRARDTNLARQGAMAGRVLCLALSLCIVTAHCEAGQADPSFDAVSARLVPGSEVTVTDTNGSEFRGEVVALSGTRIEVASGGDRRNFSQFQVREIRHHTRGPLGNGTLRGMLIGAGIGAALGVAAAVDSGPIIDPGGEAILAGIGLGAVLGTTTGVLIDVFRTENRVIYGASDEQVSFAPGVSGVRVSFRF